MCICRKCSYYYLLVEVMIQLNETYLHQLLVANIK